MGFWGINLINDFWGKFVRADRTYSRPRVGALVGVLWESWVKLLKKLNEKLSNEKSEIDLKIGKKLKNSVKLLDLLIV